MNSLSTLEAGLTARRLSAHARAHDVPGASLTIASRATLATLTYGVLSLRTQQPVTATSLFQIGSVTKVWTTALVMSLVDEGLCDLRDPVSRHLPELAVPDLTIEHLLNHTSGLPADWFPDTGRGDNCLARLLPLLAETDLVHPPGTLVSYSNAAFSLAGLLVERITDSTWDNALAQRICAPLDLRSVCTLPEQVLLHSAAVGHVDAGSAQKVAPIAFLPRMAGPAGLVTCSTPELAVFGRDFLEKAPSRILSFHARRAMRTVTATPLGSLAGGIGLGWSVSKLDDRTVLAHDGGTIGQACALRVLPKNDLVVALAANGGNWPAFRDAVLAELELTPLPQPAPSLSEAPMTDDLNRFTGTYRAPGVTHLVEEVTAQLQLTSHVTLGLHALPEPPVTKTLLTPTTSRNNFLSAAGSPVVFTHEDGSRYILVNGRAARAT